jgi:glucose-1-phosphate cytidylyltransferase
MKVVILAGGFGTRISEESHKKPKPMIELDDTPIIIHLMKSYMKQGYNEFVILAGYKQDYIKQYFLNLKRTMSDMTIDFSENEEVDFFNTEKFDANITILNTGLNTYTGGRLLRAKEYLKNEENFLLTYGDGLSDVSIKDLVNNHCSGDNIVTITSVNPGSRFGTLAIEGNQVSSFKEKQKESNGWINGGFMAMNKNVFDFLENDDTILEKDPFEKISSIGKMGCHKHSGFWQCMDTLRDKTFLETLLKENKAPWI